MAMCRVNGTIVASRARERESGHEQYGDMIDNRSALLALAAIAVALLLSAVS